MLNRLVALDCFFLNCFKQLVSRGCVISHFCFCSYGSALKKPSKWLHNQPWLVPLETKCTCPYKNNHFVAQGNFTSQSMSDFDARCRPNAISVYGRLPEVGESVASYSAAYPFELVTRMASGAVSAFRSQAPALPLETWKRSLNEVGVDFPLVSFAETEHALYPPRPWHEGPEWISEICNSLKFTEVFRYKFQRSGHINVNEARVYKSWIKAMAKSHPRSRFVGLLDSRVTIGATAKGRSSSYAISRILQGSLAYILGSGLYPGCLHCASGDNRSDGPSSEPASRAIPAWLKELIDGDPGKFDKVVQSSKISRNPARWLRFLLTLCGDIHPHPGPRARRGPMDLSVGFVKETSSRMQRCVDAFQLWCTEWLRIIFSSLLQDMSLMAQSLWFVLFRGRFASVSFCLHFDWRARVLSFNPITSRNCLANRQKVADS